MGQDLRQFLMATLTGGQGKRGHQISLPNSMTQIVGFRLKGGIKSAGGEGEMQRGKEMREEREGRKKKKWEGSRKGRREGEGQPGGRWTAKEEEKAQSQQW